MEDRRAELGEFDTATERLIIAAAGLPDQDMRAPSALAGWSRGHVVTRLARRADGPEITRPGRELPGRLTSRTSGTIVSIIRGAALPAPPPWPQGPATGRRQA